MHLLLHIMLHIKVFIYFKKIKTTTKLQIRFSITKISKSVSNMTLQRRLPAHHRCTADPPSSSAFISQATVVLPPPTFKE
jgi:hypothetical protein